MRIRVSHKTTYSYRESARSVIQLLRLTPRNHGGQVVHSWRIDIEPAARLARREDWLGNIAHSVFLPGPLDAVTISAGGEIETEETAGVVRGTVERFPPGLFLRTTPLTEPDAALLIVAGEIAAGSQTPLDRAHSLMAALQASVRYDPGFTNSTTTAAEAFASRHGVCQDLSHIFLAVAREIGLPARYVSGYLAPRSGSAENEASHAWAEVHVDGLGWVSFDAANGICATDAYVRVAIGLDSLDAAPVRGARSGGADEGLSVDVRIGDGRQWQD
jgi:transglutaminase-like putative cysteine protease